MLARKQAYGCFDTKIDMTKVSVYNLENKEIETMEVPSSLFQTSWSEELVHQAIVTQRTNARNTVAHAKGRGEVRGGGKKPWKQKGTGRARHGSIRSPIWIGGGVTFGPSKEKEFSRNINKKMRRKAIFSALSKKFGENEVKVISDFSTGEGKTKQFSQTSTQVRNPKESAVFVFSKDHKHLHRVARNVEKTSTLSPRSLNVMDILRPKFVVIEKSAIQEIIDHYHLSEK